MKAAVLILASLLMAAPLHAYDIIFFGEDVNVSDNPSTAADDALRPSSRPNSDSAKDQFLSALIDPQTESFEAYPAGSTPSFLSFGGTPASLTGAIATSGELAVRAVPTGTFNGAYPTSGDNLLFQTAPLFAGDSFNLTFLAPQIAFGFYGVDIGDGNARLELTIHFSGGGSSAFEVPHATSGPFDVPSVSGSIFYFGLIDVSHPFDGVTFRNNDPSRNEVAFAGDGFGYDDFTIAGHAVPEPATIAMLLPAISLCLAWTFRHRRKLARGAGA